MSMIEDLNKVHGRTISFRYFADKRLKPKRQPLEGKLVDAYPLYLEVKAKRQKTQRKSILDTYIIPDRLDQFLRDNATDILTETNALRERILSYKPYDNADFSLSYSLSGYSVIEEDICYLLGSILREEYQEARKKDSLELMKSDRKYSIPKLSLKSSILDEEQQEEEFDEQATAIFYRGKVNEIIEPIAVFAEVRDLAVPGKPCTLKLYEDYGKYIWGLDRYCQVMRDEIETTIISLSFFESANFRKTFKKCFGVDVYESVYNGLDKRSEERLSLRERLVKFNR